jgi:hypothetical protein
VETDLEEWDKEMDALVTWLNTFKFPPYPFDIGEAVQVIGDKFFADLRLQIDRCDLQKDCIPNLRYKLQQLKGYMEQSKTVENTAAIQ